MFKTKTAFVIGAGASKEFGLPVGSELADTIAQKCDIRYREFNKKISGDEYLFECFRRQDNEKAHEYQRAAWAIRDGILLQNSIDDYLLSHKENERLLHYGKAAIVKSVLESEKQSKLFFDKNDTQKNIDIRSIRTTWLVELTKILFFDATKSDINNIFENVCFISFNYDRCIEHFLINSIKRYFGAEQEEAKNACAKAKIIHPYGSVGILEGYSSGEPTVPFGGTYYGSDPTDNFYNLSKNIIVYTENNDKNIAKNRLHEEISQYERIVFLGFGFHHQNINLIFQNQNSGYAPKIIATTYGMSPENIHYAHQDMLNAFHHSDRAHVEAKLISVDETCGNLFRRFNKMLAR